MGGRRCIIKGCDSKSSMPKHHGVTYHSFPFDSKTRELWISNCRLEADKNITKSVLVCSRHFRRANFQTIKGGKYILKAGTIPTVFPWGKVDASGATISRSVSGSGSPPSTADEATADSVEATIAQIMAETAELNKAAGIVPRTPSKRSSTEAGEQLVKSARTSLDMSANQFVIATPSSSKKLDPMAMFTPGARLEAQDFDGMWHAAKVVEVDNDDREVLIKFEKTAKYKGSALSAEEWIPMNSSRLRQKQPSVTKPPPVFVEGERCLARWTGSRKFPATVQKALGGDVYEVLFDDGFAKTVKGNHMSKLKSIEEKVIEEPETPVIAPVVTPVKGKAKSTKSPVPKESPASQKPLKTPKKEWPLMSISNLNLDELNLPEIPKDGEWCCHWVNDQPIGKEGFLQIGDHKKPTVIVDDWRLPPNWVKHMYQRSNILGKWDVILVNPQQKRFRSKADLKQYIEEQGQVYNPDVYDFSIHRRRAKDIEAYVYTKDYKPPPARTPQTPSLAEVLSATPLTETPVVSDLPPAELMTPPPPKKESPPPKMEAVVSPVKSVVEEEGYVYVGGLKIQIIDNLFRCPHESCNKNFRKENHLQIHVKHYHQDIAKLLGVCPNMQDLAAKRTLRSPEAHTEPQPKNQIPNQQFFAKMHQQDLQLSKSHRKSRGSTPVTATVPTTTSPQQHTEPVIEAAPNVPEPDLTVAVEVKDETVLTTPQTSPALAHPTGDSDHDSSPILSPLKLAEESPLKAPPISVISPPVAPKSTTKKPKMKYMKKSKTNRPRMAKRFLKLKQPKRQATILEEPLQQFPPHDFEDTRHSFNVTPGPVDYPAPKKQKLQFQTPIGGGGDSTAEGSLTTSSFPDPTESPKYINENGEIIKIVRMKQEEIINCLCSYGEEDGLMIQCELCLCWQHGICNGIEKESQVPEKYVCYICRNPQRGRESLKYIHDQDWLYEGKLPVAGYHAVNPNSQERFELLKRSHTLTGNLIELKRFLHSLRVKITIAENKDHPKMYLWAKKWEEVPVDKDVKDEQADTAPHVPQPEAAIDSVECQNRLREHIKTQQSLVMDRLQDIESQVLEIESLDNMPDLKTADISKTKETLAQLIKDLETMKKIARINAIANTEMIYAQQHQEQQTPAVQAQSTSNQQATISST